MMTSTRAIVLVLVGLLLSARVAAAAPPVHAAKFGKVYRASKALDAATTTGVTRDRYLVLVETLSTELLLAKDVVKTPREKLVWQAFNDILFSHRVAADPDMWGVADLLWPKLKTERTLDRAYTLYLTDTLPKAEIEKIGQR